MKKNDKRNSVETPRPVSVDGSIGEQINFDYLEAFFFAYRDFVGDADKRLEEMGFGRAHHRVLFFVNKNHGLSVAQLLDILGITKQSLSRVLKQLLEKGYISQKTGRDDRRQRMLYPTFKGREFILELSAPQSRRILKALQKAGLSDSESVLSFLTHMKNVDQKD